MEIFLRNKFSRTSRGQTVIETIFMLILLLILFFLIAEFARAWYLKNSLNNATRVAVRKAVVTPGLTDGTSTATCSSLPGGAIGEIMEAVCSSPGLPGDEADTTVIVKRVDDSDPSGFGPGDTVTVIANSAFHGIAFGFVLPEYAESGASMRYE